MKAAVLLMAYGGPSSLDEVEPYLLDVRGGQPAPAGLLEAMKARYAHLGGGSPILSNTRAQAEALGGRLGLPVFVGMRHWHPYIAEVVPEILAAGPEQLVALCLAPHYSRLSVGAYFRALSAALPTRGGPRLEAIESWNDHPLFLDALADQLLCARGALPHPERYPVVFTAHSLPARLLDEGDPYEEELMETAQGVLARTGPLVWSWAYQSQGHSPESWLGPPVEEVVARLSSEGHPGVLIAPIGFVSEHVEVLYDLDVEVRRQAEGLGMVYARMATLGTHPLLVDCLAALVRQALAA